MKLKALEKFNYNVTLDAVTLRKFAYLLKSPYNLEFSAIMYCDRVDNTFHLYDCFFPKQINQATHTEYESEDEMELLVEGYDIVKGLGHMHSHVSMGVFASPTDFSEIVDRGKTGGYNASIILNKKGEIFCHIADYDNGLYVEDVPVKIVYPFNAEDFERYMMASIKECDSFQEVQDLMNFTKNDFLDLVYPFTEEDKKYLDNVVKTKFKEKSKSFVGNYNQSNNYGKPSNKSTKNSYQGYPIDYYATKEIDFGSELDLGIPTAKEVANSIKKNFSIGQTDKEFNKLRKLKEEDIIFYE